MATDSAGQGQYISADRETIRKWAGRHNAVPAQSESDGMLDLVHEFRIDADHERIRWNLFYDELERGNHAVSHRVDGLETPEIITHDQATSRSDIEDR